MLPPQELTDLNGLATWTSDGFKPMLLVDLSRGEVSSIAMSNIGFFAAACGTALAIVNLRVPEILVRDSFGDTPDALDLSREERKALEAESRSMINHLNIAVTRVASDPRLAPRVLVSRENGMMTIWTLSESLDQWLGVRTSVRKLEGTAHTQQIMIRDVNGFPVSSTAVELQRALREQEKGGPTEENGLRCCIAVFIADGCE